jgi:hypothetical protein
MYLGKSLSSSLSASQEDGTTALWSAYYRTLNPLRDTETSVELASPLYALLFRTISQPLNFEVMLISGGSPWRSIAQEYL